MSSACHRDQFPSLRLLLLAMFALLSWGNEGFAQRDLKNIPVPDPAEELKSLEVADGFEINLFAADPLIHKPIQMNFDAQGRLWAAASEIYPQIEPGKVANDKILVLEDTNADGQADKTTVFADGLLIPTAVIPGDGGAYVANSTELVHFKDTNGDGKADESRVILSGFGTEDTHHILHTFRWGFDGLLYMNQSIYIHSHIETPFGVRRLNAGGIWQYRPPTGQLEVFARGWVNTWGHHFDRYGQSFATDGAGGEGINFVVPGASYPTAANSPRILHGLNPGSPKHCGLEVVDGRHLPDDWQGDLITNDFRGHRVCRFKLTPEGTGYVSKPMPDLVRTNHVAFRPIDIKQGPDGAIYIADWYNPIIQHGEVDFRDPRRDHTHGRIWRVTAKGRPLVKTPALQSLSSAELVALLTAPEQFTRQQAKLVLREKPRSEVIAALEKHAASLPAEDPLKNDWLLESLWVRVAHQAPDFKTCELLMNSSDYRLRAATVRVLGHWHQNLNSESPVMVKLLQLAKDPHSQVRMEVVRTLSAVGTADAARAVLNVAAEPMDEFLEYAVWLSANELAPVWHAAVLHGKWSPGDQATSPGIAKSSIEPWLYGIKATKAVQLIPVLVQWLQAGKIPEAEIASTMEIIGTLGGPPQLSLVLNAAIDQTTQATQRSILLEALAGAKKSRDIQPAGNLEKIAPFVQSKELREQLVAVELAGLWKQAQLAGEIRQLASDRNRDVNLRVAAVQALARLGGTENQTLLEQLSKPSEKVADAAVVNETDGVRLAAIRGLMVSASEAASQASALWLAEGPAPDVVSELLQTFLREKGGAVLLAKSLVTVKLSEDTAKLALRSVTGSGREEPQLQAALRESGHLGSGPKVWSTEELESILKKVSTEGNAARGEQVFRRAELACMKCHAIGGAGGAVGPDLVSIGASAQLDYLLDSMVTPNKQVKENYNTVILALADGRVQSGIVTRKSASEIVLRDANDVEVVVPVKEIEEQSAGTSLMPAGLADGLTQTELADLITFLSQLGKIGPYAPPSGKYAMRWEVLVPTDPAWTKLYRTSDTELLRQGQGLEWKTAYSQVNGALPLADLPAFRTRDRLAEKARQVMFLKTTATVTTAGEVVLSLNDPAGVEIWIDGESIPQAQIVRKSLGAGNHVIHLAIDLQKRTNEVRLELAAEKGAQAKWQIKP
ncbi:PVC-type heme-binding CxxCH protein [Planctopirus hydrillae]|uniref:Cytochrome c domain-containing protein n=1 Tax=Planctopirus hydrillae TaxID=1841610 RepID=A0A1C3E8K1_9PLAN|nr:PVC-type heme-binding CxxCH protein [Planctopirus hydrillae]ODA29597.1 hypothetical protein A6X21_07930 [Planctopirus hydrillae]